MQKLFKRAISILLTLILVLSLTACGGDEETQNEDPQGGGETQDDGEETPGGEETPSGGEADDGEYELGHWVFAEDPESISGTVRF